MSLSLLSSALSFAPGGSLVGKIGSGVVSLFGSNLARIAPANISVNTPAGPLTYQYTGRAEDATQSIGYIFGQWAASGHLHWLQQIAATGSGPKWTDPGALQTYGAYDQSFARQLLQAYGAPTVGGAQAVTPAYQHTTLLGQAGQAILGTAEQQAGALLAGTGLQLYAGGTRNAQPAGAPAQQLQQAVGGVSTGVILVGVGAVALILFLLLRS